MAGIEALKILGGLWAEDGDRVDPDDSSLTVTVARTTGWPQSFSADAGNNASRRVWNQRIRELQGAATYALRFGIDPYDAAVDYPVGGRCAVGRDIYHALAANGPRTSNVTHPTAAGQSSWSRVQGRISLPSAPSAPAGTAENSVIEWAWNCPRDGGLRVTSFDVQWRTGTTGDWGSVQRVSVPRYRLSGLVNGQAYQVRARSRNSFGESAWSSAGTSTPVSTVPGKVFGLVAFSDEDRVVTLRWDEPDTGGAAISEYEIQWASGARSFSSVRQATTAATRFVVTGRVNGTTYSFRVRARNVRGAGQWADAVEGTPADPPPPPPEIPADTAPGIPGIASATVIGTRVLWQWPMPADGNRRITRFEVQVRVRSAAWPQTDIDSESSCYLQTGAVSGTAYEARARAINAIGRSDWSPTALQAV